MKNILLYGLQRSGTNYMETLLPHNFSNVALLNQAFARSLPLHKHFRPYDEKWFVPEPKYLNQFQYPSFEDFDRHCQELTGAQDLGYITIVKEPYSWYISYCKLARKNRWPSYMHKWTNQHYMIEYSLFCKKWIDFRDQAPDKVALIRYEDVLKDLPGTLDSLREKFGLEKKQADYQNFSKVNMSRTFSVRRRNYYMKKQFMEQFSQEELFLLTHHLDAGVAKALGYERVV